MNNYSDARFTSIDPLRFLELKKSEILYKLMEDLGYSEEKARLKFEFIIDMINTLRPLRACKSQTIDYTEEKIRSIPRKAKSVTINFLIKAIISNNAWAHAYNTLAHFANRDAVIPFPYNNTPDHEILYLIEQENLIYNHSSVINTLKACSIIDSPKAHVLSNNSNQCENLPAVKQVIVPTFPPDAVNEVFNLLKKSFSPEDSELLEGLMKTGKQPAQKLLFRGNGKTLLDFFKTLREGRFLSIPTQQDLEIWMSLVFEFLHIGRRTAITPKYAATIISGNERAAKGKRLIDIKQENGKYILIPLKLSNREQN